MKHTHLHLWPQLTTALLLVSGGTVHAQLVEPSPEHKGLHSMQIYEDQNQLSAGYDRWREFGLRGIYQWGHHQLSAEAINMNRFNENGNYLGLGDTWVFSPDWYGALNVGAGDGAPYLPRYRVDGFIHRKFLDERQMVGSLGLGRYRAPDGHQDDNASMGLTYYFGPPWVVQAQAKRTKSQPGSIVTQQYFMALTWGSHQKTQITGRYGWGQEGYLSLGDARSISQFASRQKTLTLQHWLGMDWGVKVTVDNYHNPYYDRNGLSLAVFKDFR